MPPELLVGECPPGDGPAKISDFLTVIWAIMRANAEPTVRAALGTRAGFTFTLNDSRESVKPALLNKTAKNRAVDAPQAELRQMLTAST